MKCPKCGYLGFEHVERCRNCGYDFSLSQSVTLPELSMRHAATEINPLDDLALIDQSPRRESARFTSAIDPDLDRVFGDDDAAQTPPPAPRRTRTPPAPQPAAPSPSEELSLFGPPLPDDVPLITRASPPRPPLAVRRATPEVPRPRAEQSRIPSLDLDLDLADLDEMPGPAAAPGARTRSAEWDAAEEQPEIESAGVGARLAAVAIDMLILAAIDAAVIYFTMQICGVGLWDLGIIPKVPLLAFLLVQNGGYLVAFTVGGQTLGKMAAGIKVISSDSTHTLDVGKAMLRTFVWLVLAVPAGLGFLSAVFSRDHRGLHDHFAGTRVVRASV
jgi:uncharacterized RDD family membrane protein YckC